MTAKLEVRKLVVRYGEGRQALTAVDGVDLTVPAGGTLGLVGESGCGKSSVARAVVRLVPTAGGRVLLNGVDVTKARSSPDFRRRVQMVFQDPYSSLNPRMTVGEVMREAHAIRGLTARDRDARRREGRRILDRVGLSHTVHDHYPHQFSGGQRQRIAIARALALGPEVILTDEVTSALDVSVQATILNLLKELQRELGLSYLFISHDLSVVRYMSDQVAVMYLGQIVEYGPTTDLFSNPRHPYTSALIQSVPQLGAASVPPAVAGDVPDPRELPTGCRFHGRCPIGPLADPKRTICLDKDPQLIAPRERHRAACHFAGEFSTAATASVRLHI